MEDIAIRNLPQRAPIVQACCAVYFRGGDMERIAALLNVCLMLRSEGASDFSRGIDSGGDTVTDGDSAPVIAGEVESGETIFEAVDFSQDFAVPDFELGDRLPPGVVFFR